MSPSIFPSICFSVSLYLSFSLSLSSPLYVFLPLLTFSSVFFCLSLFVPQSVFLSPSPYLSLCLFFLSLPICPSVCLYGIPIIPCLFSCLSLSFPLSFSLYLSLTSFFLSPSPYLSLCLSVLNIPLPLLLPPPVQRGRGCGPASVPCHPLCPPYGCDGLSLNRLIRYQFLPSGQFLYLWKLRQEPSNLAGYRGSGDLTV